MNKLKKTFLAILAVLVVWVIGGYIVLKKHRKDKINPLVCS